MVKNKANFKIKNKLSPLTIALLTVLTVYVIFMLALFLWAVITACKKYSGDYSSTDSSIANNIVGLPKQFYLFENISKLNEGFADFTLIEMAINTVLYSFGCSFFKVVVTCVVAYLCARYENWFSKIVYTAVIVTMIIPVVGNQAAEIQLANLLGLYNEIWGMWLMRANFLGMYFLVFYSVFKTMPKGYYEAAKIDGANDMQVMIKVALPLIKYTFLSIFLILFIEYWNDYLIPNLYLPAHKTLSLALYHQSTGQELNAQYKREMSRVPALMASVLVVTVPVIILFCIFSKRLMGNLSVGGLKG
ncbi:MAG: carbohydrate ABC transporter permease [Clostridia bacterium]|nr:carbohydrate ABC transporter permease [Clostridia bacterium]